MPKCTNVWNVDGTALCQVKTERLAAFQRYHVSPHSSLFIINDNAENWEGKLVSFKSDNFEILQVYGDRQNYPEVLFHFFCTRYRIGAKHRLGKVIWLLQTCGDLNLISIINFDYRVIHLPTHCLQLRGQLGNIQRGFFSHSPVSAQGEHESCWSKQFDGWLVWSALKGKKKRTSSTIQRSLSRSINLAQNFWRHLLHSYIGTEFAIAPESSRRTERLAVVKHTKMFIPTLSLNGNSYYWLTLRLWNLLQTLPTTTRLDVA